MTERYQSAISKVWKEALSTEEKLILLEQITRDETSWKASLQHQFQQDVHNGTQYLPLQRSELILHQLHERIRLMDETATGIESGTKVIQMQPRIIRWAMGMAAAILIIAVFLWYPFDKSNGINKQTLALYKPQREYMRHINRTGKEEFFSLSDGSKVRLGAGSEIVWIEGFTGSERKIQMGGKAWFDVAKDSRRPFSVDAGNITTTALGTKFMVNTLRNSKVAVQLFEGKVKIESESQGLKTVYLEPGQQCIIDAHLQAVVSKLTAVTNSIVDTESEQQEKSRPALRRIRPLEFVQTPLVEVLSQLGHRYKVQFKYDLSEISNDQVTGTFLASDSLKVTLKLLQSINNLSFSQYQDTILVSKLK
ncbi:FecR family protein [Pseudoflavitalea rhizosphaerae]|uniref:FecR family protein n=1 Tax=Pseudoflavitalea rhizosphaerae TaxID=1884793 RepID=UPI000F8F22F8|nr:FecR family protein [Pseudoflavitalea rhizosphaerae]